MRSLHATSSSVWVTCSRFRREGLLRKADFADAYLVLSDVHARRHDYRTQLQDLESYLKLDPAGPASELVRRARAAVLKVIVEQNPAN